MRALLVHRDDVWRRALSHALSRDYCVDQVDRLHDAIAYIAHTRYDVIVVADALPDGGGLVLLEQVRATHAASRCVLVSRSNLLTGWAAGGDVYHFIEPDDLPAFARLLDVVRERHP